LVRIVWSGVATPAAEIEHETLVEARGGGIGQGAGATQDRCDLRDIGDRRRQRSGGEHALAAARQTLLGQGDQRDHALISIAGGVAKAEDAVLYEHQPLDIGLRLEQFGGCLGQQKARHDVGHDADLRPVEVGAALGRIGLIGEAQHRNRMCVVDEFMRQKGMQ
jgi:hypothetical protein